jgi:hypothetical protein
VTEQATQPLAQGVAPRADTKLFYEQGAGVGVVHANDAAAIALVQDASATCDQPTLHRGPRRRLASEPVDATVHRRRL